MAGNIKKATHISKSLLILLENMSCIILLQRILFCVCSSGPLALRSFQDIHKVRTHTMFPIRSLYRNIFQLSEILFQHPAVGTIVFPPRSKYCKVSHIDNRGCAAEVAWYKPAFKPILGKVLQVLQCDHTHLD